MIQSTCCKSKMTTFGLEYFPAMQMFMTRNFPGRQSEEIAITHRKQTSNLTTTSCSVHTPCFDETKLVQDPYRNECSIMSTLSYFSKFACAKDIFLKNPWKRIDTYYPYFATTFLHSHRNNCVELIISTYISIKAIGKTVSRRKCLEVIKCLEPP